MISGDGIDHTPCRLYTNNPKFNKEQAKTDRGNRIKAELYAVLKKYNIGEERIVYEKSNKHYCAESANRYEHFLNNNSIPFDTLILHDGGNAFKRGKNSIFDSLGFRNHVTYPTDTHQFLSPNDNKLHGVKTKWKEEYSRLGDDVSRSLRLMELIDIDTIKNSQLYFRKNLFNVKKSHLKEYIGE